MDEVDRLPRERIRTMQEKALRVLLSGLEDRSRFFKVKYQGRAKLAALDPREFAALPPVSKTDLLNAQGLNLPWGGLLAVSVQSCSILGFTNALAAGVEDYTELHLAATSGDMARRVDVARRALSSAGSGESDRTAMMGEIARSIVHHVFLGGLAATDSTPFQIGRGLTLRHVRHTLPVLAPTQLLTYPTYARYLARLLEEEGAELPLERLLLWGEVGPSVPAVREELGKLWPGTDVKDIYAMEEFGVLAAECPEGEGLHTFEDQYYYEVVDPRDGRVLDDGERGELVITPLHSEAMPLVRYRTGDLVVVEGDGCACGRSHRRLRVLGRVIEGSRGPSVVDLASLEELVIGSPDLSGQYRVIVDGDGAILEAGAGPGAELDRVLEGVVASIEDQGLKVEPRVLAGMPSFCHRTTRAIPVVGLGLWNAMAEEQRRLEE